MLGTLLQAPPFEAQLGGTAVTGFLLLDLVLIFVAARIMGGIFVRVGQPRVVGEIVAGVLLGPTLLGAATVEIDSTWFFNDWLPCTESATRGDGRESITHCLFPPQSRAILGNIGQIALVFFMFLVGLELNFKTLKGKELGIGIVGIGVVIIPVLLGIYLVGPVLYDKKFVGGFGTPTQPTELAFGLMIAAMLSVTAFPVMARILQEKGLTSSAMGAIGVAAAAVVTVLMFMVVSVASSVAKKDMSGARVDSNFDIGLNMAYVLIYVAVMMGVVRPLLARTLGPWYEKKGLTSEVFAIILIVVFASAYAAHQLDVNVIVGGFMAGAALPVREMLFKDLSAKLAEVTGTILLPVFLAFSGLATDFTRLEFNMAGPIAVFLIAGIAGKWIGGAVFARAGGLTWPEGNVIGILMNCRGLLVLVVGLIAFQAGVITAPMQVAGVLMALITTAMTGPLFDAFLPMATRDKPPGGRTVAEESVAT